MSFDVFNATSDGVHLEVTMLVNNPSVFAVNPMGDVRLLVYYADDMGTSVLGPPAVVQNMAISPGPNMCVCHSF